MRITVKKGDIEITIDRPNFDDKGSPEGRINRMKDTVVPTLELVIEKVLSLQNGSNRST